MDRTSQLREVCSRFYHREMSANLDRVPFREFPQPDTVEFHAGELLRRIDADNAIDEIMGGQ